MSGGWNSRLKKAKRSSSARKPTYNAPVLYKSPGSVSKSAGNFKTRMNATLTYSEFGLNVNSVAGVPGVRVFDLNSLFDVDVTGIGHQPVGYDQIMALYETYTVISAKYKVCMAVQSEAVECIFGATATDALTAATDPRVYLENGMTNWKIVPKGVSGCVAELAGYVDLAKLHGIPKSVYLDDNDYLGFVSTTPNERGFLHVWEVSNNASTSVQATFTIQIEYEVLFKGGKLNALS